MLKNRFQPTTIYYILIAATTFAFSLHHTMSGVFRVDVGLTPMQLILVGTIFEISIFLFEVPTGIVADLYSRRLSVMIGYAVIGLGFILEGSFPVVGMIWLAQIAVGLGFTFVSGARTAWLADEIGEQNLTAVLLRATQIAVFFDLLGIALSSLIGMIDLRVPLIASGIALILAVVFLAGFMPENRFQPTPQEERDTWNSIVTTFRDGSKVVRNSQVLLILFAIAFVIGLSSEGLDRYWEAHFLGSYIFPPIGQLDDIVWFSMMRIVTSLLTLGVTEWIRRRINTDDEQSSIRALILVKSVMIAGIFLFALAGSFELALAGYWTTFVFRRMTFPLFEGWLNQRIPTQVRATVLSMHGQIDAIGEVISGPFMGLIATIWSIRIALTGVGSLWLLVIPLLVFALIYTRREQPAV